jgi:hypothetical protein
VQKLRVPGTEYLFAQSLRLIVQCKISIMSTELGLGPAFAGATKKRFDLKRSRFNGIARKVPQADSTIDPDRVGASVHGVCFVDDNSAPSAGSMN